MKLSLRSQFYVLVIPFAPVLLALLVAGRAPYFSVDQKILLVERHLAITLALQQFADSFSKQVRGYENFIVTSANSDATELESAAAASHQNLTAWRELIEEGERAELELFRRVSADHARVTKLSAEIVRLHHDGRKTEAAALLRDHAIPLNTAVTLAINQCLLEHQQNLLRAIARIEGGIGHWRILQFRGMLEGIDDLDSHVAEVLESAAYRRAIEAEVRGIWIFFLSRDRSWNVMAADHERVKHAHAAWRLSVMNYGGSKSFGGPEQEEELQFVDGVHSGYLALHADGERVIDLCVQGSDRHARELLLQRLKFENTPVATALHEYTAHETEVVAENLAFLKREVSHSQHVLLASSTFADGRHHHPGLEVALADPQRRLLQIQNRLDHPSGEEPWGLLGTVSPKGQRMLEIAVSNTDRLVRLINDILDVERIESGKMDLVRTVSEAFDLMKRAIEGVQSMADQAGVRLVIEPASASVMGDGDRIIQTLTNLVGNAIKFSPRDTAVTVSATPDGQLCTFRIADQGRGIPDDKLEMIFERFQQADASDSRDKGGSGLGLAISRSIVHAHGGRIWAHKNEPAGAVFQFTMPLAPAPAVPAVESERGPLMVNPEADSRHSAVDVERADEERLHRAPTLIEGRLHMNESDIVPPVDTMTTEKEKVQDAA